MGAERNLAAKRNGTAQMDGEMVLVRNDEPTDTGKTHERIGVYMTGNGDHSHQPYVKHGRTFYIKGEGDETIRQQIELDANKLKKYDVYRFNPESGEFDIPSVEKLRVLPRNAIVFSNDRTLMEALMYGDINATAALYNMEGKATNGHALNFPWYIDDLDDFVRTAKLLYGWKERWWARGKAYYNRSEVRGYRQREVEYQINTLHNEDLLRQIEAKAKEEQDCLGRHPLTGEMMDGSSIGGGSKVRMQYQVECECITNRYGQRWDYELGGKADRFVEGLIRTGRLDEVWRIDNDEAAEFYPVSHTGACRCRNK